jgi:hypothetical protein
MSATTITGTYTATYYLKTSNSPLTNEGTVHPVGSSNVIGVYSYMADVQLINKGQIVGGYGFGNNGPGGAGVDLSAGGSVRNTGSIAGGHGHYSGVSGSGGDGGAGVILTGGTLTNTYSIAGGEGGYGVQDGGSGGVGVDLTAAGSVINHHSIYGGDGNEGYNSGDGAGGAGVYLAVDSALTNTDIIGGGSGGSGGAHANGASGGVGVAAAPGTVITNTGSIVGGNGGYSTNFAGGSGGVGAYLSGGTLTTSGTISGGAEGTGVTSGAAGDAVRFGTSVSTLVVDPGAVFNGQVVANASVDDTLKLSGSQAGGTPITLGGQFTDFSTLTFVSAAAWTVDAGAGAAPGGGLIIDGFTTSDSIDVTNLTPAQVEADFNSGTHTLSTPSDGTLDFAGHFSGDAFLFSNDGSGGTDITLVVGSGISSILTSTVTVGGTAHKSPLTISNAGGVAPSITGATGVVSSVSNNSVTNEGAIQGGAGALNSSGVGGMGGFGVNLKAGTLTNTGSITGGAGGKGSTTGGHGGAGVELNGGTLITSGSISGGVGGTGTPVGGSGDAVQFGTAASTLIVDPGAVFNGQVVGNASVHDVLELSGTQAGGTPITLGTQFTNFSMLQFAPGATGTVDATVADLTAHPLSVQGSIAGFGLGDTLDITNLVHSGTTYSFDASTEILSITKGATTIQLGFDSAFSGDHFVLASNGHGGTDVTLQTGAATEPMALHGFSSHAFTDHGLAHDASVMMS